MSTTSIRGLLAACALLILAALLPSVAQASSGPLYHKLRYRSPSGNVVCQFTYNATANSLLCSTRTPGGSGFMLDTLDPAIPWAVPFPMQNAAYRVLPYNHMVGVGRISLWSSPKGWFEADNAASHGFRLGRGVHRSY